MGKADPQAGYREALRLIAETRSRDWSDLNLTGLGLTALPPEVGSLKQLRRLHLQRNQLTSLPPEIGRLESLWRLDLSGNHLTTLPREISSLTALVRLDLAGNPLTKLPPMIGTLTALRELYLEQTQLTTLPSAIGSLTKLETLYIFGNQLVTLPPEIGSLNSLEKLYAFSNRLGSLPTELANCKALKELFLHRNESLAIPASVLGPTIREVHGETGKKAARPADILNFYFARESASAAGTLRAVNELKVMLVGRGGAGKTSIRRFFLNQPHDAREPETPGIALDHFPLTCGNRVITVLLWDFAGQEITHALHQFFLTEGCIYILVLDPRSNTEMPDACYWMDQLQRYAPRSPVIVALNRQDSRHGGYDVDQDLLTERYTQIKSFVKTNCETRSGCPELRAALKESIGKLARDEPPRLEVPAEWLKVKDECWGMSSGNHALKFAEFSALCAKHSITEVDKQESLARLLHKLGAVLHFVDDPRLRDTSVLRPHWVTDGVYRLLRCKDRPRSDGILNLHDAIDAMYDKSEVSARYLLGLMERFEMCFPLEEDAARPNSWLIPGALNPYQPAGLGERWKDPGAVRLRYDYLSPVAEGLIPRFIVLTHPVTREAVWRNGVVLRDGDAAALVRRGEKPNYIEVAAFGTEIRRLRLLELIQGTMDRVNAAIPGKAPLLEQEIDSLPGGATGIYKPVDDLKAAERAETPIVVGTTPPPVLVDAGPQLDRMSQPASRDPTRIPMRTFLSYAHGDRRKKSLFAQNLAVMQGRNLVSSWHDGMIEIGKDWKKELEEHLESIDLFIGLLTTAFLASSFIQKVELRAARARLFERQRRDFLFVLIVAEDHLSTAGLNLSQYKLIFPGNRSISQYSNQQAFFNQAQKEIEQLITSHTFQFEEAVDGVKVPISAPTKRLAVGASTGTTAGVTIIVQGDYLEGSKHQHDDHSVNVGDNAINVQVAQRLSNCTNLIQQQAPGEKRVLLEQLQRDMQNVVKGLTLENSADTQQLMENLEMLVKQATSEKPNRKWYSLSAEGLLEASKFAKDFSGNILGTVGQLGKLIWPDYQPPQVE